MPVFLVPLVFIDISLELIYYKSLFWVRPPHLGAIVIVMFFNSLHDFLKEHHIESVVQFA